MSQFWVFFPPTKDGRENLNLDLSTFCATPPPQKKKTTRGLAYAPYADLLWVETSTPDLDEARDFAAAIHAQFPGKLLAYNCSPSFNWRRAMDEAKIATFQKELGALGYRFQFVTLAGFHSLNHGMFELAKAYGARGMAAYSELQTVRNRLFEFSPPSFFFFFWISSSLGSFPLVLPSFSSHSFSLSPPPKKLQTQTQTLRRPSSPPRLAATPRPSTSARSARATSTPCRRS